MAEEVVDLIFDAARLELFMCISDILAVQTMCSRSIIDSLDKTELSGHRPHSVLQIQISLRPAGLLQRLLLR